MPVQSPRHLHIRNVWEHSPTRKKIMEMAFIKDRGAVRICVTAPIYLPGPTNPWALHTPIPPAMWRPTWASAWTRVDSRGLLSRVRGPVRHLRIMWARAALPCGLTCRVASAQVPRATLARGLRKKNPFLCDFN